jgi:hypothetical protein
VGVGEDRRGRLAPELLEREASVLSSAQQRLALLDVGADERTELVQGRAVTLYVLLERERKVAALLELPSEHDEGAERETAQQRIEMRRANSHPVRYGAVRLTPRPLSNLTVT